MRNPNDFASDDVRECAEQLTDEEIWYWLEHPSGLDGLMARAVLREQGKRGLRRPQPSDAKAEPPSPPQVDVHPLHPRRILAAIRLLAKPD